MRSFESGQTVVRRDVHLPGRVRSEHALRVVRDTSEALVVACPPGAETRWPALYVKARIWLVPLAIRSWTGNPWTREHATHAANFGLTAFLAILGGALISALIGLPPSYPQIQPLPMYLVFCYILVGLVGFLGGSRACRERTGLPLHQVHLPAPAELIAARLPARPPTPSPQPEEQPWEHQS
ncbi:hypothetical protein ACH4HG_29365 [Streptomyces coeruleorubidus]|uniref:hypothetical protein n=1 Tax=Streptomyces coeruleorubidus TaxID=116188 RepID=UPI00378F6C06